MKANTAVVGRQEESIRVESAPARDRAADALRNELLVAAGQFSTAIELHIAGDSEAARHAAIEACETLRLACRDYASTRDYQVFCDMDTSAEGSSPLMPETAVALPSVQYATGLCILHARACKVVPESIREQVVFWLESLHEGDAGGLSHVVATAAIAVRVLKAKVR